MDINVKYYVGNLLVYVKALNDELNKKQKQIRDEDIDTIQKNMTWVYSYVNSVTVPTKTSVTKIKELANEENIVSLEELAEDVNEQREIARKDTF